MRFFFPVTVLLTTVLSLSPCLAVPPENLQKQSVTIGKLREEISRHEEKIEQSGQEEFSLLDELEHMDETIRQQKTKIEALKTQVNEQQLVIGAKEKELTAILQKNKDLQLHLTKRLKAFYLMGKTGFYNIAFSSKTLPELLLTNEAFHSLITYDQSVFAAYRNNVAAIDRVKRSHELEKSVLENFLAEADQENAVLQQEAEKKNLLLKRVQTQRGLYEQAIKEMQKAESTLTATFTRSSKTRDRQELDFQSSKGTLPPPAWGKVISLFRQPSPETDDTTFTNGITINTPDRAEVYAVYDGEVIFSGTMRGYGKMLIIDHDLQYYTVTARLNDLRVKEGTSVRQGQVIGRTGKNTTIFGQGLYFEIRHGAIAQDPLAWLQPGALTIPESHAR